MWGRQGLDPRHLLSPFTTLWQAQGSPTCTRLHRGPWVLEKMSPEATGPQGVVGQALGLYSLEMSHQVRLTPLEEMSIKELVATG